MFNCGRFPIDFAELLGNGAGCDGFDDDHDDGTVNFRECEMHGRKRNADYIHFSQGSWRCMPNHACKVPRSATKEKKKIEQWLCECCGVVLNSQRQAAIHYDGGRHLAKVKETETCAAKRGDKYTAPPPRRIGDLVQEDNPAPAVEKPDAEDTDATVVDDDGFPPRLMSDCCYSIPQQESSECRVSGAESDNSSPYSEVPRYIQQHPLSINVRHAPSVSSTPQSFTPGHTPSTPGNEQCYIWPGPEQQYIVLRPAQNQQLLVAQPASPTPSVQMLAPQPVAAPVLSQTSNPRVYQAPVQYVHMLPAQQQPMVSQFMTQAPLTQYYVIPTAYQVVST
ncbi:hypothetical protein DIPPA_15223 [Diplonema papillatum]|nr:hypothetical protein DIPPA_15223 [Diplonema papillatum]